MDKPSPAFQIRAAHRTATPSASRSPVKSKHKGKAPQNLKSFLVKKPEIITKTHIPLPIIAYENDEDSNEETDENTRIMEKWPVKSAKGSKHQRPGPNCHSATSIFLLVFIVSVLFHFLS